ncbi:DUF2512 domain-containing protein [Marinococcus halophilus]|uniref:DUF2512 family protein n=1 Tax=Marinococcus halophilus TaxID=1371 RepID=A0A510YA03_MARHA|nr:DUF2512 family protein [Marinococcus halophilus]OZT78777.1 DUF2512 domain-containing protein [Marinococcus halophilus]GEK60226.1 hypothetical protein MHA01_31310 [Marinococcus halophilus]
MKHIKALTGKSIMTAALLFLVLSIANGVSIWSVLVLTIIIGAISYPLGDLVLLPRVKSLMAAGADAILVFAVVLAAGAVITFAGPVLLAAVVTAVLMGAAEYMFHFYMGTHVLFSSNRLKTDM